MEHQPSMPTEDLVRTLWKERFPDLALPEDFIKNWLSRTQINLISAFDVVGSRYKKSSTKTALDIAKMISGQAKWAHVACYEKSSPEDDTSRLATTSDFRQLWESTFPQFIVPGEFMERWEGQKRNLRDVLEAFKVTKATLGEDLSKKTSVVLALILTSQITKIQNRRKEFYRRRAALNGNQPAQINHEKAYTCQTP